MIYESLLAQPVEVRLQIARFLSCLARLLHEFFVINPRNKRLTKVIQLPINLTLLSRLKIKNNIINVLKVGILSFLNNVYTVSTYFQSC